MRALVLILLAAILAGCSGAVAQAPPAQDGLDLAVVRSVAGNPPRSHVLLIDADGREPGRVVASPQGVIGVGGLGWASDGRLHLVGVVGDEGSADAFTVPPGGGAASRFTSSGDILAAAMSPDGGTVALARQTLAQRFEQRGSGLWLVDAAGGEPRPLVPAEPGRFDLPGAWSPDGRQLAFTRRTTRLQPDGAVRLGTTVWIVNADGTEARRIAEGFSPAWSPDGTRIAFASARARNGKICGGDSCHAAAELYTMAPDGADLRRLTRTADEEHTPAWSADGRWLAYELGTNRSYANAVWTVRPDGTCARPLAGDGAGVVSYRSPAWRPGALVARSCAGPARHAAVPAVAPDGLGAARAFRGFPLYWLGPVWQGRRLTATGSGQPNERARGFFYGDCRTFGADCSAIQYQVWDVCTIPPPDDRGRGAHPVLRTRIRGAPAFLYTGSTWEVYTGRVVIRVFSGGREGRRLIAALRGLNAPARGLRPGRPFPPPIRGALERQLPCP